MTKQKLPDWLKIRINCGGNYARVHSTLRHEALATVCESAECPNRYECFRRGTATLLILGDVCTRSCGFCAVDSGVPQPVDIEEPRRAANFVMRLGLKHAVITSVTRDDLEDGGASSFAETVNRIRSMSNNKIPIELLTPDFKGSETALDTVLDSRPDVFNHNIETVEQLQKKVRPQADYRRSLRVLKHAAASGKTKAVKSGIMVGLGEDDEQLFSALNDLLENGCQYLTIGQYLAPSHNHLPVRRFVRPEMFVKYREKALAMGFKKVASAPLVRSSYLAENFLDTCGGNKLHDQ